MKKKIANLSKEVLYDAVDAEMAQGDQLASLENERDSISEGIATLNQLSQETSQLFDEACKLSNDVIGTINPNILDRIIQDVEEVQTPDQHLIDRTETILTGNDWAFYCKEYKKYIQDKKISTEYDPFLTSLSQRQYIQLNDEINGEFARKTSIANSTDISFLAIAIALQVAKSLIFPIVAQKAGYGESFDKNSRKAHNDPSIKAEERQSKDKFRDKKLDDGHEKGEWIEILYRKPIFDTTRGSPDIGINMEGGYHRIHTLGHDPILGWIFGTGNILTDTITLDTLATYQGTREPAIRILPERVPLFLMFQRAFYKIRENPLNLPAALAAEKIHLKSDEFTKAGLPVPVLEVIAPKLAGNLYKKQYDALCFSRDLKIIGTSAAVSMLIDMVIGLVHALYYVPEKDGSKELFEVRTRKILLISNTIATTSNIVYASITRNPKNLDLGGLFVTLTHLFSDTQFIVNVKQEFIENKIYEKIEDELASIERNQDKLLKLEFNNAAFHHES